MRLVSGHLSCGWYLPLVLVLAGCGSAESGSVAATQNQGTARHTAVAADAQMQVTPAPVGIDAQDETVSAAAPVSPVSPIERQVSSLVDGGTVQYTYRIVNTYPHDSRAFTQGLIYVDGELYEGTGLYGRSTLRHVDLETGEVLDMVILPAHLFGEGITLVGDRLVQLTWKAGVGLVYSLVDLKKIDEFNYPTEGWGITYDGSRLIMSDGTSRLHFLDPDSYTEQGYLDVFSDDGPVDRLNELEYVNGQILANLWKTDQIAIIDPSTGRVTGWVDLSGLLKPEDRQQPVDVLNGVAYDPVGDHLYVTGKLWPKLFEIELAPMDVQVN